MTGCPLCGAYATSLSQVLVHMRIVHAGEPGFQVRCGVQGCPRTFRNFHTFRNHIYAIHGANLTSETDVNFEEPEIPGSGDHDQLGDEDDHVDNMETDAVSEEAIQKAAALFILKIREGHRIPLSVMDEIVQDVSSLYQLALSAIRQRVKSTLEVAGVGDDVIESTVSHLSPESPLTNIFRGLGTHYQQRQYYKRNFDLVEPVKIVLGTERQPRGVGRKRRITEVEESMVYVPILKTLEVVLKNDCVADEIERGHESTTQGVLADYCDGEAFQTHPLFSVQCGALEITLYYDDVEICNPLGSKRKKHKQGFFYFTLCNLRPRLRSKYRAIQLVAICKTSLIDKYSMNAVLRPFVDDLKKLETGCVNLPLRGVMQPVHGTLAVSSADNPANSLVGGFKRGSTAHRYCRQCLGTSEECSCNFSEESFVLRDLQKHLEQCDRLDEDGASREENSTRFGVNNRSILLELRHFDLCSGALVPDIMHDLFEGVLQYEMKLVLQHCVNDQKYFTLSMLQRVMEYAEFGHMEVVDKPTPITSHVLNSKEKSLGQKAAQSALLGRLLPYLVAEYVPEDDEYWANFLLLLRVVDLLMAPRITEDEVACLSLWVTEHHTTFVELYPNETVIPKMHYMVHMPRLILKFGPLVHHWTMRFEAKHNYFKKLAHNLGNYINVSWTLALRHQMWQCYQWLKTDLQDDPEVGPGNELVEEDRPLELRDAECCYSVNWVRVNGQLYKELSVVVLEVENDYPLFGLINQVYMVDTTRPVAHVNLLVTRNFCNHYHGYVVERSPAYKMVSLHSLHSPFPLHVRKLRNHAELVVMKHHICDTLFV